MMNGIVIDKKKSAIQNLLDSIAVTKEKNHEITVIYVPIGYINKIISDVENMTIPVTIVDDTACRVGGYSVVETFWSKNNIYVGLFHES